MSAETFLNGRVTLHAGDMLTMLPTLPADSIDAVVCDPPYGISFMGKAWDHGVPSALMWSEVLRLLKPGGHLLAFAGTRTQHRMACAIEDAGFEIRDMVAWVYGSGFPKSHNGPWGGTALKPALEPITLARKPLQSTVAANVLAHGTGALNIAACRVGGEEREIGRASVTSLQRKSRVEAGYRDDAGVGPGSSSSIVVGRWPANLIHDGSAEVIEAFPYTATHAKTKAGYTDIAGSSWTIPVDSGATYGSDSGSAARFFYSAKADADDRLGSKHPTVKPLDLIQYLVRLVTPPGGLVLDCFAGTGTTGEAAWREGMRAVLCEREPEYQADIRRRMELCLAGPDERRRAIVKAKACPDDLSGTLFAPVAPMAAE